MLESICSHLFKTELENDIKTALLPLKNESFCHHQILKRFDFLCPRHEMAEGLIEFTLSMSCVCVCGMSLGQRSRSESALKLCA